MRVARTSSRDPLERSNLADCESDAFRSGTRTERQRTASTRQLTLDPPHAILFPRTAQRRMFPPATASVDVSRELSALTRTCAGVSDRSAQRTSSCLRLSMGAPRPTVRYRRDTARMLGTTNSSPVKDLRSRCAYSGCCPVNGMCAKECGSQQRPAQYDLNRGHPCHSPADR
jgi:hypothetical protein